MSGADRLELGSWNAICYECGFKFKAADLIKHWKGYYVCRKCFEPRHPQDFVRAIPDVQTPPWIQPRPSWYFGQARAGSTGITTTARSGTWIAGDGITTADIYLPPFATPTALNGVTAITINTGGTDYTLNDQLTFVGGTGSATVITATAVTNGVITSAAINNPGAYTTSPANVTVTVNDCDATFSATVKHASITLSNGSLTAASAGAPNDKGAAGTTLKSAGKFYCEVVFTTDGADQQRIGIATASEDFTGALGLGNSDYSYAWDLHAGLKYHSLVTAAYGGTQGAGVVIGMLFNADAGELSYTANGVDKGVAYTGISGTFRLAVSGYNTQVNCTLRISPVNWTYDPPAGYVCWGGTSSVTAPTVTGGTGTGAVITPTIASVAYATFVSTPSLLVGAGIVTSNGNLVADVDEILGANSPWWVPQLSTVTQAVGGSNVKKRYCEFTYYFDGACLFGVAPAAFAIAINRYIGMDATSWSFGAASTAGIALPFVKWTNGASAAYGTNIQAGWTVSMLLDSATGNLVFWMNGGTLGTAFSGITGTVCPAISLAGKALIVANFGATAWKYTPPAGYIGWIG